MALLLTPPEVRIAVATETTSSAVSHPRRTGLALVVTLLVVAGVAVTVVAVAVDGDEPSIVLVGDGAGGIAALDPSTGISTFSVDGAAVSADGSTLYQAQSEGDATVLRQIDPSTGAPDAGISLEGRLEIRSVSPDGDAAVLMAPRRTTGLYVPEPRETTSLTVYWRDRPETATFELPGNFEPETFTLDEQTLYLLEFWPPLDPDRYFVRRLDLATGTIGDVYSPEVELGPEMRGRARAQVIAPDHTFLYTLYSIPDGDAPVVDPAGVDIDGGQRWAFVHVLSLTEDWSFCVFLPVPIGTSSPESVSLTMAPDGRSLYVVDPSTQHVAIIDIESLSVRSSSHVPAMPALVPGDTIDQPHVAVTSDGQLFVADRWSVISYAPDLSSQVVWISPANGEDRITDLDVSADGSQLHIGLNGRVVVWDPASGQEMATFDVPGDGDVSFAGPPGSLLVSGDSFKCAC